MRRDNDLIAYFEERRRVRWRALWTALGLIAAVLLLVFVTTFALHSAGVGSHTQTTVNISATGYHVTRQRVGGLPILP